MPNTFAYIVLFSWPIVVYLLFRRLPPTAALGWTVVAGYLLLPTQAGLDVPGVPTIDKDSVPILSAGLMLLFGVGGASVGKRSGQRARPGEQQELQPHKRNQPLFLALLVLLLVSPILTVFTNPDPVSAGPHVIPGLNLYDAGAVIGEFAISVLPFLLAWRWFASPESHVTLLKVLVLAMLGYSLLTLFEVRMSPQLNVAVYGFFPHEFLQHIRAGGYRPVVFLQHGLWLAILQTMTILAAVALWRQRLAEGARSSQWLFAALYFLLVLFLSNSLGALAIALALTLAAALLTVRAQVLLAGIIAGIVLIYPMLRATQIVPVEQVLSIAGSVSEERAASLEFRLVNEEALLDRAALRPVAGWGMWGRPTVSDPVTGLSITVSDSAWIISLGTFGWLGYLARFGLLTLPVLLLATRVGSLRPSAATAGLALIMAANLLDLLSNDTITPISWLISGAVVGRLTYRAPVAAETPTAARRDWAVVTDLQPALSEKAIKPHPGSAKVARRGAREA